MPESVSSFLSSCVASRCCLLSQEEDSDQEEDDEDEEGDGDSEEDGDGEEESDDEGGAPPAVGSLG